MLDDTSKQVLVQIRARKLHDTRDSNDRLSREVNIIISSCCSRLLPYMYQNIRMGHFQASSSPNIALKLVQTKSALRSCLWLALWENGFTPPQSQILSQKYFSIKVFHPPTSSRRAISFLSRLLKHYDPCPICIPVIVYMTFIS